MTKREERLAAFLIDCNDTVDLVEAALARLADAPADGEAMGQGIDACRCLARRAAPLGHCRLANVATGAARRLSDALNARRALDEEALDGLIGSAKEVRTILIRLEANGEGGYTAPASVRES